MRPAGSRTLQTSETTMEFAPIGDHARLPGRFHARLSGVTSRRAA
ncbi:hypothetical protein [Methylobrevis albus]|nr:hypothetical protein [Methylobrevis albus]